MSHASKSSSSLAWIALVAGLALLLLVASPYMFSLFPQTHITIRLSPVQTVYAPNQQVTVTGVLTCSGMCPMAAAGYAYMDVRLSGSWGWSQTVQTNGAGIYSCSLTLPSTLGTYQISGVFYQNGSPAASATTNFQIGSSSVTSTTSTTASSSSVAHTSSQQTITKATTTTSTGTSTSTEVSTSHTTTTVTSGSGTGTGNAAEVEDWLKSKTSLLGYDVPNWWFIAGFLGVLVLLWLLRRRS